MLTAFKEGYLYGPTFSPDGKTLAFSDGSHKLWTVRTDGGAPKEVAQDKYGEIHDQAFSPDGRWIAFSLSASSGRRRDLHLYEIATGKLTKLGNGSEVDYGPAWSADGKYLYFVSNRHENAVPAEIEFDFEVLKSNGVYAIALARNAASPVAPKSDEADSGPPEGSKPANPSAGEKGKPPEKDQSGKGEPAPIATSPIAPIKIDLDGLMARAVALPIEPSEIGQMDTRGDRIYYLTQPLGLIEGNLNGEKSALHFYDLKKRKDAVIAEDVDSYSLSLDGERVLIKHD